MTTIIGELGCRIRTSGPGMVKIRTKGIQERTTIEPCILEKTPSGTGEIDRIKF
jgi:hypothetical protein